MSHTPRHALVLSGGGATSAYAAGVAHALLAGRAPTTGGAPLAPAVVAGTSAGAFNAAYLLAGGGATAVERAASLGAVWIERLASRNGVDGAFRLRLRAPRAIAVSEATRFVGDGLAAGWALLRGAGAGATPDSPLGLLDRFDAGAFFLADGWRRAVRELIDYDRLARTPAELLIAATDWLDGSVRVFGRDDVARGHGAESVLASSAVPGFLPPVTIEGRPYVDGSIRLNAPLLPALGAGADVLHVVALDTGVAGRRPAPAGTMRAFYRSLAIGWDGALERDLERVRGTNVLLAAARGLEGDARARLAAAAGTAAGFAARPVTVHRYVPTGGFSDADGFFDLTRDRIAAAVECGFLETTLHDCRAAGCVLAEDHPPPGLRGRPCTSPTTSP